MPTVTLPPGQLRGLISDRMTWNTRKQGPRPPLSDSEQAQIDSARRAVKSLASKLRNGRCIADTCDDEICASALIWFDLRLSESLSNF